MSGSALEAAHRERRRETKIANERARNHATALTQLASAVVVAGIVVPTFARDASFTPATIALSFMFAALLYALGHLMLSTVDLED